MGSKLADQESASATGFHPHLLGEIDEARAWQLYARGAEAVTLTPLALIRRIAELQSPAFPADAVVTPSTPSGMIPVYAKPAASGRRKKAGAKEGHPGARRTRPQRIDRRIEHRLKRCPDCGGRLQRCHRSRTRIIEDIPEEITPVVTEHTIHRDYCPHCKKDVESVMPDAMPGAILGHHIVGLTSWFHYGLGITLSQVIEILGYHLQTKLSAGGLIDAWGRLALVLTAWYGQIAEEAKKSAVPHADETGWRVEGQTHWLWCFANPTPIIANALKSYLSTGQLQSGGRDHRSLPIKIQTN